MKKIYSSISQQLSLIKRDLEVPSVDKKINKEISPNKKISNENSSSNNNDVQLIYRCNDSISGQPLERYEDELTARINMIKGWHLRSSSFQVRKCNQCGKFHLYPEINEVNINPKMTCPLCKRGDGKNKICYSNSLSALEAMRNLTISTGLGTRAYPCLHGNGWHVTKKASHSLYKALLEFEEHTLKLKRAAKPKVQLKKLLK